MKVFITGATGFIGSAIVRELIAAGHQVTGLTRTEAGAKKLLQMGAAPKLGTLDRHDLLRQSAAESDGVIHTAFIHGFQHLNLKARFGFFAGALRRGMMGSFMHTMQATEAGAVHALGSGLAGSQRPLVVASGILGLPQGRLATESDSHLAGQINRAFSEKATWEFVPGGVRASVVRLAPTVHGEGDHGFIPEIIKAARKNGVSAYPGDGANRWPAVHRLDAARLFRLALESGKAGARYHGVAEEGIAFREIAARIGDGLKLPVSSRTPAQAKKHFGFLAMFTGFDNPASSEWTQSELGWKPEGPSLFDDLEHAGYFNGA